MADDLHHAAEMARYKEVVLGDAPTGRRYPMPAPERREWQRDNATLIRAAFAEWDAATMKLAATLEGCDAICLMLSHNTAVNFGEDLINTARDLIRAEAVELL